MNPANTINEPEHAPSIKRPSFEREWQQFQSELAKQRLCSPAIEAQSIQEPEEAVTGELAADMAPKTKK